MAGLCEGGNEPPVSLKAIFPLWFLPRFSTAVGLKPDGLWRVLGINPFDLITWLGFSDVFPNQKANAGFLNAFLYDGAWIYPIYKVLDSWPLRIAFFVVSTGFLLALYVLGELLNSKLVGDNAGEMSPGSSTESYPAFARIGLRENPGKTSTSTLQLSDSLLATNFKESFDVVSSCLLVSARDRRAASDSVCTRVYISYDIFRKHEDIQLVIDGRSVGSSGRSIGSSAGCPAFGLTNIRPFTVPVDGKRPSLELQCHIPNMDYYAAS
ncbi:hypothetical protein ANN_14399 [Periplaneta americana]|uniref:Uncharacterized protein n=1 Tax=Periplaneta americana TaxID=6978 RepID=A0ABQ8SXA2_PERAM|nr:hypothetical protein ANN_14399 [Periplaneta americana]